MYSKIYTRVQNLASVCFQLLNTSVTDRLVFYVQQHDSCIGGLSLATLKPGSFWKRCELGLGHLSTLRLSVGLAF